MKPAAPLTLISHDLCPYVQRASIVLSEKDVVFSRRYVDLAAKPDWFQAISPLGKTPVLQVGATALLNAIAAFYNAPDARLLAARREDIEARFAQLEDALDGAGPYFSGQRFSMVDAVFGPVFRYLDVFVHLGESDLGAGLARVRRWRDALARRPSVQQAVSARYAQRLQQFLLARGSELSRRIAAHLDRTTATA